MYFHRLYIERFCMRLILYFMHVETTLEFRVHSLSSVSNNTDKKEHFVATFYFQTYSWIMEKYSLVSIFPSIWPRFQLIISESLNPLHFPNLQELTALLVEMYYLDIPCWPLLRRP